MGTDQPGSQVRDCNDAPVFTGSRVLRSGSASSWRYAGEVVELLSTDRVRVRFGGREETLAPGLLRVLVVDA